MNNFKSKEDMKYFSSFYKKIFAVIVLMSATHLVQAQSASIDYNQMSMYAILGLALVIALLVLFVAMYMLHILKVITKDVAMQQAAEAGEEYVEEAGLWTSISQKLTGSVPIEEEATIELDHNYDGIRELDNHLPPWWTYLFYLTIVFAVVYMFVYHVSGSLPLQEEEYANEISLAEEQKASMVTEDSGPTIDENNAEFTDEPSALANGQKVYISQCAACHKEKGEGGIGPNLTDEYWLHGGSFKEIFYTIKYGVPEKGMIAWEPLLSPVQMRDVSSYIKTLAGTNPPNAKDPQGELYVEEASTGEETGESNEEQSEEPETAQ